MCSAAGLKGMVILFDEFEDVLTNINNINHKEAAFGNLFRFVSGDPFTGKTFYAVTPSFMREPSHHEQSMELRLRSVRQLGDL